MRRSRRRMTKRTPSNMIRTKMITYQDAQFEFGTEPINFPITINDLGSNQILAIKRFSHYRIKAIKFSLIPKFNVAGQSVTNGSDTGLQFTSVFMPTLYTLFVNNRDEVYDELADVQDNPRHKVHKFNTYVNRYTKLATQTTVTMGSGTSVDLLQRNCWLSSVDTDAVYGRFVVAADNPGLASGNDAPNLYNVRACFYLELKNLNVINAD